MAGSAVPSCDAQGVTFVALVRIVRQDAVHIPLGGGVGVERHEDVALLLLGDCDPPSEANRLVSVTRRDDPETPSLEFGAKHA